MANWVEGAGPKEPLSWAQRAPSPLQEQEGGRPEPSGKIENTYMSETDMGGIRLF